MTFKEGLLKARGQIAFVMALAISTGVIIRLEALDTEDHIQSRVAAEVARQKASSAPASPSLEGAVKASLRRAEEAYAGDPGPAANTAALLTSLSTAVQLGVLKPDEGLTGAERVLSDLEKKPGTPSAVLTSALMAAAVAFPALQGRATGLAAASR